MALGFLTVLITLHTYVTEVRYFASLPRTAATSDAYYYAPSPLRWAMVGITSGLIAMGLGAVLFYLRRLYLSSRLS